MGRVKVEKGDRLWFKAARFLLPYLTSFYFKLVDLTSKKIYLNREQEDQAREQGGFTMACFHGTMLYPIYYGRRSPGVIMVSRSWDGDLIDRCIRHWGFDTTRGSSSQGGKEALARLIYLVKTKNCCSGLAVDAPRGPAQQVKMGTLIIAREAGQPVLPLLCWTTRHIQFGSWDRMILPLPFSTIVLAFGKLTRVPEGLRRSDYLQLRQQLENDMIEASNQAQTAVTGLKQKSWWRMFRSRGTRASLARGDGEK